MLLFLHPRTRQRKRDIESEQGFCKGREVHPERKGGDGNAEGFRQVGEEEQG